MRVKCRSLPASDLFAWEHCLGLCSSQNLSFCLPTEFGRELATILDFPSARGDRFIYTYMSRFVLGYTKAVSVIIVQNVLTRERKNVKVLERFICKKFFSIGLDCRLDNISVNLQYTRKCLAVVIFFLFYCWIFAFLYCVGYQRYFALIAQNLFSELFLQKLIF